MRLPAFNGTDYLASAKVPATLMSTAVEVNQIRTKMSEGLGHLGSSSGKQDSLVNSHLPAHNTDHV